MAKKNPNAFRTISEVSEWLDTPTHVLRFWESRFPQVKPVKRAGGRRYYRPGDMLLLGGIRRLLHDEGITIKGVQKILRERGVKYVVSLSEDINTKVTPKSVEEAIDSAPEAAASETIDDVAELAPLATAVEPEPEAEIKAEPTPEPEEVVEAAPVEAPAPAPAPEGSQSEQIAALYSRLKDLRDRMARDSAA